MTTTPITLFLAGDVMTGRGVDQVLLHPSDPRLYEPSVRDARDYVRLAESANGPVSAPVAFDYVWGDGLVELERRAPDVRIINLETSVTTSDRAEPKGINYRMHPGNVPCLTAARIDCCVLANNHVLDWGYQGLLETLDELHAAGLKTAGAGRTLEQARAPALIDVGGNARVLVFAFGSESSGIPQSWAATAARPGIHLLADLSARTADDIASLVSSYRHPGDVVVASVHWGTNWGYDVPLDQRRFAHELISRAGVDVVHGHSSHHVKGIEVYRGRLIFYGCGDLLNDYEGILGHAEFRDDLPLMYFVRLVPGGELLRAWMAPFRIARFRLARASSAEARWVASVLDREGRALGTHIHLDKNGTLVLEWTAGAVSGQRAPAEYADSDPEPAILDTRSTAMGDPIIGSTAHFGADPISGKRIMNKDHADLATAARTRLGGT